MENPRELVSDIHFLWPAYKLVNLIEKIKQSSEPWVVLRLLAS